MRSGFPRQSAKRFCRELRKNKNLERLSDFHEKLNRSSRLTIRIAVSIKNRYIQRHGIQVQMHWRAYFRAAGPLSPAGAVFCVRVRCAQQPTSLIE
ncbi:hypothetical protein PO872_14330 [Rhizobium sp. MC62]|nr:hypothetical protein [Rhizobium sp. MC62]